MLCQVGEFLRLVWNPMRNFSCELCQQSSAVQYRVRSSLHPQWTFVCPDCWPVRRAEEGYQYGGTRKSNRRERRR